MSEAPPAGSTARQWLSSIALAAYVVVLLLATMWPTPLDQGYEASIDKVLGVLHRNGVPEWFGYNKLEFSANVMMFVPLGFLVVLLLPGKVWWLALFICPALSVAIELTQATLLTSRFATVTDVVANSLGAIIGILVAITLRAIIFHRDEKLIARAIWVHQNQRHPVRG